MPAGSEPRSTPRAGGDGLQSQHNRSAHGLLVLIVFVLVYAGMILGEIPGLALDRSGIALLGAIAILATGELTLEEAWRSVDVSTMALLFGLMVMSAQFRLGGFYSKTVQWIAAHAAGPETLLLCTGVPVTVATLAIAAVTAPDQGVPATAASGAFRL